MTTASARDLRLCALRRTQDEPLAHRLPAAWPRPGIDSPDDASEAVLGGEAPRADRRLRAGRGRRWRSRRRGTRMPGRPGSRHQGPGASSARGLGHRLSGTSRRSRRRHRRGPSASHSWTWPRRRAPLSAAGRHFIGRSPVPPAETPFKTGRARRHLRRCPDDTRSAFSPRLPVGWWEHVEQVRRVPRDSRPENVQVDVEVVVDEPVTHPSGCRPWNVGTRGPGRLADLLRSFADDLDELGEAKREQLFLIGSRGSCQRRTRLPSLPLRADGEAGSDPQAAS